MFEYKQSATVVFKDAGKDPLVIKSTTPNEKIVVESKDGVVILSRLEGPPPAHEKVEQWVFPHVEIASVMMDSIKNE